MISHRLTRLFLGGAASGICDEIEQEHRCGQREPLERVAVVLVDTEVGRIPLAREPVVELALLLDDDRLHWNGEGRAVTFERQVLPYPAFGRVRRQLEKP